ncbi:MAG: hypothetical protein Q3Y08_02105 [Butyricicoccus sp.]|nr:hypothetical protein [Butyricicoccus sp.]
MRMVLCARCARDLDSDRDVKRIGMNSRKDQCQMCGRKSWCGAYDVATEPREVSYEKKNDAWLDV